ncbi:MAG: hypothetical protein JW943_11240 [Deltaproteobacteria bacterium]|nr:hypothetical protein [Deltaproteobacteria bacterium]
MNEYNWKIEHQCPQCGAPVILDEADRLLFCPFCRTRLYLTTPDHFRYHIPIAAINSADLVYIPYWRLKGNGFLVQAREVAPRFIDINSLAVDNKKLPASLGLRPQVMNLKFTSPDMPGRFLQANMSSAGIMKNMDKMIDAASPEKIMKTDMVFTEIMKNIEKAGPIVTLGRSLMADLLVAGLMSDKDIMGDAAMPESAVFYHTVIGEVISLIYSPGYIEKDILYDAFTRKPILPWREEEMQILLSDAKPPNWQIRFVSTLCPRCGWDLEGEKNAVVMTCRNCDSVWNCPKDTFEPVPFSVMPNTSKDAVMYLPFWRMTPRCEGITLSSYADLIRAANLPKAVQPAYETQPVYFWSPAFKVNPALFIRLARQMTLLQPPVELNESFGGASVHSATLPMTEAVESMMITLACVITDKRRMYPKLANIKATADDVMLVYHPFRITLRELIHLSAPLAIDRQALNLGVHL